MQAFFADAARSGVHVALAWLKASLIWMQKSTLRPTRLVIDIASTAPRFLHVPIDDKQTYKLGWLIR